VESPLSGRALVTGGAGFIGSALCRALLRGGAEVHGVSRLARDGDGVRWWRADLADAEAARAVLAQVRPDVVFHLASRVTGKRGLDAVLPTLRDNLVTTVNLLTAACEAGAPRVVLAGSMEECDPDEPRPVPGSPYAAAKTAASGYARMFHAIHGLPVVTLRVFMVYGPGQRDGAKLIPYVTTCLLRDREPLLSSGHREIDWVYVDDVAAAFLAAANAEKAPGQTLDVGSGEVVTIRELVARLARLVGSADQPQFGALDDRPLERRRVADLSHTQQMIGWAPSTSLDEGLARTVDWFRAQEAR
jgi:UDP-glucose 4-epimerase